MHVSDLHLLIETSILTLLTKPQPSNATIVEFPIYSYTDHFTHPIHSRRYHHITRWDEVLQRILEHAVGTRNAAGGLKRRQRDSAADLTRAARLAAACKRWCTASRTVVTRFTFFVLQTATGHSVGAPCTHSKRYRISALFSCSYDERKTLHSPLRYRRFWHEATAAYIPCISACLRIKNDGTLAFYHTMLSHWSALRGLLPLLQVVTKAARVHCTNLTSLELAKRRSPYSSERMYAGAIRFAP